MNDDAVFSRPEVLTRPEVLPRPEFYCAFLRGVNINGRILKMTEVCDAFRSSGMEQVSSVLATGNIVFQAKDTVPDLRDILEMALNEFFQTDVNLFVKGAKDIWAMLEAVPFTPDPDWHIYIFICDAGFERVLFDEFAAAAASGCQSDDSATVDNGYFFWRVKKGSTLDTPFSKILGNRKFKEKFTSRNISTIEKICKKMAIT